MNVVLKAYNDLAKENITQGELEQKCKMLKLDTVKETKTEIVYKRICVCALLGKDRNIHALPFYVLDVGKINNNGDVNTLVSVEYGLL